MLYSSLLVLFASLSINKIYFFGRQICVTFFYKKICFYSSRQTMETVVSSVPSSTGQRTFESSSTHLILILLLWFWYQFFTIALFAHWLTFIFVITLHTCVRRNCIQIFCQPHVCQSPCYPFGCVSNLLGTSLLHKQRIYSSRTVAVVHLNI